MINSKNIPLSLYIHIPWCVRKCPYCDFNSHESKEATLPEEIYVAALMDDLSLYLPYIANRQITSIFFGGGTPSLFTGYAIEKILSGVNKQLKFAANIEITLEANPGTIDYQRFKDFRAAGVNRLSLGIQSLQDEKLTALGRIHNAESACKAIGAAQTAGFDRLNIDLMHGLPNQTLDDAMYDLNTALTFGTSHLSWYQLTIEPNTLFHHQPPLLPPDDDLYAIQEAGFAVLENAGLKQYEVSAFSIPGEECLHNKNYWQFGDYLGIGAGAHSKLTHAQTGEIHRFAKVKHPKDYLEANKRRTLTPKLINDNDACFEFMLNALRLTDGIPVELFKQRTGVDYSRVATPVELAIEKGLLVASQKQILPSKLGRRYLNDLVIMFLTL